MLNCKKIHFLFENLALLRLLKVIGLQKKVFNIIPCQNDLIFTKYCQFRIIMIEKVKDIDTEKVEKRKERRRRSFCSLKRGGKTP